MSSEVVIRIRNLSKRYQIYEKPVDRLKQSILPRVRRLFGLPAKDYCQNFDALDDVSFDIKRGDTVGIVGKNGSGKSTLLQIICGTLQPSSGVVETKGRVAALLELGSGFNPEFSGRENVYMYASVLGLSEAEIDERYQSILEFADIGDFIQQPIKTYSSGMVVRLAFAVVAHVNADILVIDEALSVGDAFFVQKCMRFMRDFMQTGTVLFVSHDTSAVLSLCESAVWLDQGAVQSIGEPKALTERYLEKLYESVQGESSVQGGSKTSKVERSENSVRDMRLDFINQTQLRNDVELFLFSSEAPGFGKGGANITDVQFLDEANNVLSWVVGGEEVKLVVHFMAKNVLESLVVGFQVKDRLGQVIFADNTYLSYVANPIGAISGECFKVCFDFIMPVMPVGDYTVTVAIADGMTTEHIQHHWMHDALAFKVHSSSVCYGLIGVPMQKISMESL
jgi:lipopolysaccharide transport system ATP-binding protein